MNKKNLQIKIGIGLILLSGVAFAVMLIIPFLDLPNKYKVIGTSAAFIAMEVLFWVGGFFVGKELFKKYKSYLDPRSWFGKKKAIGNDDRQAETTDPAQPGSEKNSDK